MVSGTWKSLAIWMNAGSFSMPSSMVTNTTLSLIGTFENTCGCAALNVIGFTAGGVGAGANGLSPLYRWLISSASTPLATELAVWLGETVVLAPTGSPVAVD